MARIVLIVIDALPHRLVGPAVTPNLWEQVRTGGRAPTGAVGPQVSVTYAAHAALVTGADPATTGVWGNRAWDGGAWVPAPTFGPGAPTLFDRTAAAGIRSVLVVGDQHLVAQMGGAAADEVWPPAGELPEGTPTCALGYATDEVVLDRVARLDLDPGPDPELLVVHLNEPDTAAHLNGPDSIEALARYRATDAVYGRIVDLVAADWSDTVCITVSDHDQEPVLDPTGIDLVAALAGMDGVSVSHEGTGALLHGPVDEAAVRAVPGVEAVAPLAGGMWLAWAEPGRVFGRRETAALGQHGSPRCRPQVAVVSGGHPAAAALARRVERRPVSVHDWAPVIADLLGSER